MRFDKPRLALAVSTLMLAIAPLTSEAISATAVLQLEPVASGLPSPVAITSARDGSGRLFVTLQGGRVVILDGATVLPAPFLDIGPLVSSGGERGLLSLAFHPRFTSNGFFYVDYTDRNGDTVIARYTVSSANRNVADPSSTVILLRVAQPFSNHNGGQLQFGPDGFLYVGMGDGGSAGDPGNRAQDLSTLLGKLLRIDVDSGALYTAPFSNPFASTAGARAEIWALGLRNPWRFSFDRQTGDLLIGDVGQNAWEEIDFQPATSGGGENYGWRRMEGTHCFNPPSNCEDGSLVLPILEYSHSEGCSVTGGYVYRGKAHPRLWGTYIYGDFCSGTVWGASRRADGSWSSSTLLESGLSISAFGEDEDGELYVADLGGTVYRLVDPRPQRPRAIRR